MSGQIPVRVTVDDRERECGTVEALGALDGVEVVVERLPVGDYEVDGRLLFERKTLVDLVASIKDGRVFHQACRLASSPLHSVIILEGTANDLALSGMRREAIQGALITLTLILGMPLLRAKDADETTRLMVYAAKQVRRISTGAIYRGSFRPRGKRRTQLHILQGLPGIGPERAQRLLDEFGSVEAVFLAGAEELMEVSGIGAITAEAIRWAVGEESPEYVTGSREFDDPML